MATDSNVLSEALARLAARGIDKLADELLARARAMSVPGADAALVAECLFRQATWPIALKHSRTAMAPARPSVDDELTLHADYLLYGPGTDFEKALVEVARAHEKSIGLGRAELPVEFEMRSIEWLVVERMIVEQFGDQLETRLLQLRLLHFAGVLSREEILPPLRAAEGSGSPRSPRWPTNDDA